MGLSATASTRMGSSLGDGRGSGRLSTLAVRRSASRMSAFIVDGEDRWRKVLGLWDVSTIMALLVIVMVVWFDCNSYLLLSKIQKVHTGMVLYIYVIALL